MSFSTKRAIRKISATRSKAKNTAIDTLTVQDLPSLRRKRTIAMNRMAKALEVGLLAREDDTQCDLFLSYCDQAKKIANDFEQAHFAILEVFDNCDEDNVSDDDRVRARFDEIYFQVMSMRRTFTRADLNLSNSDTSQRPSSHSNVKLPKLQLPTFSGDIKKWPEFYDTFNALIHDSHSLTDVEKFHYLNSSLTGDPLALIRVFPITGDFYTDAYAALVARYQDKRELAFTCWKDFLTVNFKIQNPIEFRRTLDSVDENLCILKKLNLPVDQWDFVIVYHVLSKLDTKLRRDFEERCSKSEFPKYLQLKEFLHLKCEALMRDSHFSDLSKTSTSVKDTPKSVNSYSKRPNMSHTLLTNSTKQTSPDLNEQNIKISTLKCSFCGESHSITQCKAFLSKSIDDRRTTANEKGWCYNCLKGSHQLRNCVSIFRCIKCRSKHHSLICDSDTDKTATHNSTSTESKSVSLVAKGSGLGSIGRSLKTTTVLLATAIIQIPDAHGEYQYFRALFDTGSQNNFITLRAAQSLNLKPIPCQANVNGLGGVAAEITGIINCPIASKGSPLFNVDMYVMSTICGDQPIAKLHTQGWSHIETLPLADPGFDIPGPVDVLLGADVFADSVLNEHIKGDARHPLAIHSVFGWLLLGRSPLTSITSTLLQVSPNTDELASIVHRFWELDIIPTASPFTPEEVACESAYVSGHYRDSSGRYVVQLPFKDQIEPTFVGSRDVAVRRFKAIERRLSRDPLLHQQYSEFMEDYLQSGHMSLVSAKDLNKGKYYIPHHCVMKPDSATTKLRVVFDASAEDLNHKSLNKTLLTGPKLQSNIAEVLLYFRLHSVVFMADIRQMYRQILVSDNHRDYQRIVWRNGPDQVLQEYRLNTVTYGVSSAPFLACRTIKQLADDEGCKFPVAKNILATDIYVDDVVTGCETLEDALEAKSQIKQLFSLGHFQLRKWASNEPSLLSDLSPEECLLDSKTFSDGQHPTLKVLGLKWDPTTDAFLFDVKSSNQLCTKRNILSELARIFDPLGFLSPLTIKAKCLMQRLWILGVSWDEDPPEEITYAWKTFCEQLPILQELHLPRRLTVDGALTYELHGFCDSSELAYGAIIYLRTIREDGSVQVRLLCAKARVTPIKKVSLPRLELCSAVLLADLVKFVLDTYLNRISVNAIHLWSDSTVVLSWLRSHSSRWTTFVANRVSHIQEMFPSEAWRHVSSSDNPADVCSRGQLPHDLLHNSLWWSGPSWLLVPSNQWVHSSKAPPCSHDEDSLVRSEERQSVTLVTHENISEDSPIDILLRRFSSLEKITRIVAYLRRFYHNLKNPRNRQIGIHITKAEANASLLFIVKFVQTLTFHTEIERLRSKQVLTKPLQKLNPFLDEEGILRVGGRLSRAGLEYEQRYPALLPSDHPFTSKLIESVHREHCHTGQNTTHYLILQRFWILSAKRAIRHSLSRCIRCFRTQPKPLEPYMSDLPSFRVNQVKPFSVVGVDFGGPFRIKIGRHRGAKMDKAYLCLFICLAIKAVHLEVVSTLSTDGFIATLRRFVGRRGRCSVIHADRGTNFVGASNYLSLLEQASHTERIKFKFNPASAPHFGGVWEIQIKAAKTHLYRVVGNQVLTFEELTTLFVQIEAVLNSRPLYPLSTDPNDLSVLTPGHFLTLEPLTAVPDEDLSNVKLYRLNRWQLIQSFLQNFWIRWKNEYLNSLTQRAKWTKAAKPLNLNSVVVIKDDNRTPMQWSMGRVIDLHPGPDGIIRVATIKTKDSLIKRPLVKLCPLPIEDTN